MTSSLHWTVNVKIKYAHWFDFLDFSTSSAHKQFLNPNFQKPNTLIALRSHKDDMSICTELTDRSDLTWQSLSLWKNKMLNLNSFRHFTYFCTWTAHRINDLNELGMMVCSFLFELVAMNNGDAILRVSCKLLHNFLNVETEFHTWQWF